MNNSDEKYRKYFLVREMLEVKKVLAAMDPLKIVIIQRKLFYTSNRPQKSGNFPLNKRSNAWLDFTPCFLHVDR